MLNLKTHSSLLRLIKPCFSVITFAITIGVSVLLAGCDDKVSSSNFSDTYLKILVAREQVKDSAKVSNKVAEILKDNGFTEESFRQEFIRLSRSPKEFRTMMDSVQAQASRLK